MKPAHAADPQHSQSCAPRDPDWNGAREYVLSRLEEELPEDLYYHGLHHTQDDVLPAAERLAALAGISDEERLLLRTAALYHDVGFVEQYAGNEPIAVRIAAETLPGLGYSPWQVQAISEIILATRMPQQPHGLLQELICDADLDSLGREDYIATSCSLRDELDAHGVHIPMRQWYERQLFFLRGHRYFTQAARSLRGAGKQANIALLEHLIETTEQGDPD